MRTAKVTRKTKETEIQVEVDLDGIGKSEVKTGLPFLDHLLTLFSTHSLIDIKITASGDLDHHLIEDVALALGDAINKALGERVSLVRFGSATVPMDEALAVASIDLVMRPYCSVELKIDRNEIEGMAREDIYHFFRSLSSSLLSNIHLLVQYGANDHHKVEAALKALALSIRQGASIDPRRLGPPSSKGMM